MNSPRIDSHCHLWALERGDYFWMDGANPDLKPIVRDFGIIDLDKVRRIADISAVVLVQAAPTIAETEYLLSLADKNEEIRAVVGWVDLAKDNAAQQIDVFAKNKAFKGIRPMLQDIENTDWLIKVPQQDIWKHLAQKGLRFDALVKPRHLSMIKQFCLDHQELPIVIDHIAKPEFMENDQEKIESWLEGITQIAHETHAYCKLSGILTEMASTQLKNAYEILKPIIDHLIHAFGPNRVMWGSDWPVIRLAGDYAHWNELTLKLIDNLDQESQQAILFNTANDFYDLEVDL